MEEKIREALKSYHLKVYNIHRARGAYLLETNNGLKHFKFFEGSIGRAQFEHTVKEHLLQHGYYNTDLFVKTSEGGIISLDSAGNSYIMKNWFRGEGCNLNDLLHVKRASVNLANLHLILTNVELTQEQCEFGNPWDLQETFEKRNRELKRVRSYIIKKKQRNEFEISFLTYYDEFFQQGQKAVEELRKTNYPSVFLQAVEDRKVCHGNYTYHNIIMLKQRSEDVSRFDGRIATTNFEKAHIGVQISDLYQLIRKVMEKNDWNTDYGISIIKEYHMVKPISKDEFKTLYLLLLFPEKFWKVTNYYFNSNKSWVSRKNIQKLQKVGEQNQKRNRFLLKLKSAF